MYISILEKNIVSTYLWFADMHIASICSGDWDGHTAYNLTKKTLHISW